MGNKKVFEICIFCLYNQELINESDCYRFSATELEKNYFTYPD